MPSEHSAGRPRRSSRQTLQDAAHELFLEQGYEATTVDDIARRAGISRSTFWAYARSKSDLLWLDVDAALDRLETALAERADASVDAVLMRFAASVSAADAPLPLLEVETMGIAAQLRASAVDRLLRLVAALERAGTGEPGDPRRGAWQRAATLTAAGERWLADPRRADLARELEG